MSGIKFGNGLKFGDGIRFGEKSGKKKRKTGSESDTLKGLSESERRNAEEYRGRAKAERKRFVHATDSEYWLCLCFPDMRSLDSWNESFGFGENHGMYRIEDVREAFGEGSGSAISFGTGLKFGAPSPTLTPDPLAGVVYSGDLERDCVVELDALHDALVNAVAPVPLVEPTDSDKWLVIVFHDRDAKEWFISSHGLARLGDKYLDGMAVAKALGVQL